MRDEQTHRIVVEILDGHEPVALPTQRRFGIAETRACSRGDWEGEVFAAHLAGLLDDGLAQHSLAIQPVR